MSSINRLLGVFFLCGSIAVPAMATAKGTKFVFKNCSLSEKSSIKNAVGWLKNNHNKIDSKMGKNKLMKWPGKSHKKFKKKLKKTLKFSCISEKKRCNKAKKNGATLGGRTVPVLHQKRIALCTNNLSSNAWYTAVIAHEIAHLIRINSHRKKCKDKYTKPRFSQSVGLAVYHAYTNTTYKSSDYTKNCK